jgi:hypothetical protein
VQLTLTLCELQAAGQHTHEATISLDPCYAHPSLGAQTGQSLLDEDADLPLFKRFWDDRVAEGLSLPTLKGRAPADHPACWPTERRVDNGAEVRKVVQRHKHCEYCATAEPGKDAAGKPPKKGSRKRKREGKDVGEPRLLCRHDFERLDYGENRIRLCKRHKWHARYFAVPEVGGSMTNTHWRSNEVTGTIGSNSDQKPIVGDINSEYMTYYMAKSLATTKTLVEAARLINIKTAPGTTFASVGADSAKRVIMEAALKLQTNRVISSQEMMATLLGLNGGRGDQYRGLNKDEELVVKVGGYVRASTTVCQQ